MFSQGFGRCGNCHAPGCEGGEGSLGRKIVHDDCSYSWCISLCQSVPLLSDWQCAVIAISEPHTEIKMNLNSDCEGVCVSRGWLVKSAGHEHQAVAGDRVQRTQKILLRASKTVNVGCQGSHIECGRHWINGAHAWLCSLVCMRIITLTNLKDVAGSHEVSEVQCRYLHLKETCTTAWCTYTRSARMQCLQGCSLQMLTDLVPARHWRRS